MNIEIANRLVKLRKEKGLSQEDLADALGISRQAVSKWERAEASPDTDNLICLARLYNISLDEILDTDETSEEIRAEQKEKTINKESIDINKDCINITDDEGNTLRISNGKVTAVNSDGTIYEKEKKFRLSSYLEGVLFLMATVAFILLGSLRNAWASAWIIFFVPEIICSIVRCFEKKNAKEFNVFFVACAVYFFLCMVYPGGLWHPMWVVFLSIPVYHAIVAPFSKSDDNKKCEEKSCDNIEKNF